MAVENLYGSRALDGYYNATPPVAKGDAAAMNGKVHCAVESVEVSAAASVNSTYTLAKVPTNARVLGRSRIDFDDLASTGSPTIDLGFFPVNSNFTADDDCVRADIDVSTAASGQQMLSNIDMYGKYVWQIIGLSADPGGEALLKATIKDAACNTGGTLSSELMFTIN
jgi:hypothetical protein